MTVWYAGAYAAAYQTVIRRNYFVYATLGTYYSVWMTVWYAE
jgi:hypothetical protein